MVLTSRILQDRLGIDPIVANYFANERKVPANNAFWANKRIYLSVGFGYLTIPFAFDVMLKRGLSADLLLQDEHITRMEEGFDRLRKFENNLLSQEDFIKECTLLIKDHIRQPHLASDLFGIFSGKAPQYFEFETKHKQRQ